MAGMEIMLIRLRSVTPGAEIMQLIRVTKESLYKGIEKAVAGG